MSTLPPMPPRTDSPQCTRCGGPRVAFNAGSAGRLPGGLRICITCDMGGAANAGPPVLLDYIRRGHHA